tara:strand:+ start:95 stop:2206 length:2112 start_codon:yes stop_codon:yes gene_type:complete
MTLKFSDFGTNYNNKDRRKNFISKVKMIGKKRKIWLHQFVHFFGNEAWIPISIGRIAAQCRSNEEFNQNFEIMDLQYERKNTEQIVKKYEDNSILAFSVYIWNVKLSLEVARLTKKKIPNTLIVFGGPSAPDSKEAAEKFLRKYSYVDILVSGEGETTFLDLCLADIKELKRKNVPSLSWIENNKFFQNPQRKMERDFDKFASPFLDKTFDSLIKGPHKFHAIWETNRGCPYACGFCYWGDASRTKIVRAGRERLEKEMDWFAENKIELLYIADSNFGWVEQDKFVAEGIIKRAKKHGYPKKVILTWAKNPNKMCFEIANILNTAKLCFPITISYQSLDNEALKNIKRTNITIERSKDLRLKYHSHNIPTYTDLLIGVPGETIDSFKKGVENTISYGEHDQLQIYPIRILPNTDMARKSYIEKHKIKTIWVPLQSKHGKLEDDDPVQETEEIIVSTSTMPITDWKKMMEVTWFVQSFFCLKSAYFISLFLNLHLKQKIMDFAQFFFERVRDKKKPSLTIFLKEMERFDNYLNSFINKNPHADFSDLTFLQKVRWPIEEITFIKLMLNKQKFYSELKILVNDFISSKKLVCDPKLLNQIFDYQQSRVINPYGPSKSILNFDYNIPQFFQSAILLKPIPLKLQSSKMKIIENYKYETLSDFAQYHVWYGRQGKEFYYQVSYDEKSKRDNEDNNSDFPTAIPTINT